VSKRQTIRKKTTRARGRVAKEVTRPCTPLFLEALKEAESAANAELTRRVNVLVEMEREQQSLDRTQWAVDLKRGVWVQRTGA